jgi:hypothetical protein
MSTREFRATPVLIFFFFFFFFFFFSFLCQRNNPTQRKIVATKSVIMVAKQCRVAHHKAVFNCSRRLSPPRKSDAQTSQCFENIFKFDSKRVIQFFFSFFSCPDPKVRTTSTPCETASCADCKFQWAEWGQCSMSCGQGGRQIRTRSQTQGAIGQGKCNLSQEDRQCMPAPPPCPVPCMVTAWSEWSACGGTCAPALRQRVRDIFAREMFGGMTCPNVQESDQCFALLPLCVDATLPPATTSTRFIPPTPRPTPSPTPAPPTPVPTAPPVEVTDSDFGTMMVVCRSSVVSARRSGLVACRQQRPARRRGHRSRGPTVPLV